ncbi:MAG: hypothetical protein J4F34_09140 [Gemmatimonadetes bacterium]|nr:hypothetical protein [Gemmatimonadota bacterium]
MVFTLPTKAAMDHAGEGWPPYYPFGETLPTEASWRLPAMGRGDTWERTVTVPGAVAGYYMAAVAADTHGPASALGPYLFDDSHAQAWMFVSATNGQLTDVFEDSLFPEGVRPVPGPFTTGAELLSRPATQSTIGDSASYLYLSIGYYHNNVWRPAVGAEVWGQYITANGEPSALLPIRTVPEDGIVQFPCPTENMPYMRGGSFLPRTLYINGRLNFVTHIDGYRYQCQTQFIATRVLRYSGPAYDYLPWRNLSDAIPLINDHFGYSRSRLEWEVDLGYSGAVFKHFFCCYTEHIKFGGDSYHHAPTAAHEYTHALHYESMGGLWGTDNCSPHEYYRPSSYTCAFSEGLAGYGAWVGSPRNFGPKALETVPDTLRDGSPTTPKPKVEAHVAALFYDLIDAGTAGPDHPGETGEPEDKTHYDSHYVMKVFATCEVEYPHWLPDDWEKRNDVADFVWCLENRVDTVLHDSTFPGIGVPHDSREEATEPSDWSPDSIRSTWRWNLK